MIPSQVLQNTIEGIRDISHLEISVTDADGHEVASTAQVFGEAQAVTSDFISSQADSQSAGEFRFFKVFDEHQLEYILILKGGLEETLLVGRLAALQISGLLVAFKERYDRDSFMKNLLLDNLLLVDIYGRAKKLRIPLDAQRVVMIIETVPDKERNALESMQEFVGASATDFVTAVDENNVVRQPSWDWVFLNQYYHAFTSRESNPYGRALDSYLTGDNALLEAAIIEEEVFEIENGMWEH